MSMKNLSTAPRFEGEFHFKFLPRQPWYKFKSQKIQVTKEFTYFWQGIYPITIPAGFISDGYSIPKIFQLLTLNQFTNYMSGLRASVVHDYACENYLLTSENRISLFDEALQTLNINKYDRTVLTTGVRIGSFLGYCSDP